MKRPALPLLVLAAVFLAPISMQAKPAWVKKAQEMGFKEVQNCQACHTAKPPALAPMGQWLKDEKAKRKADQVDLAWIKDYKP